MKAKNGIAVDEVVRRFTSSLQGFENDATLACRALQVSMALNVFGVGKLLHNNLPSPVSAAMDSQSSR